MLTELRLRATGRAETRQEVLDEADEIMSYIQALLQSNPILCRRDSRVPVFQLVKHRLVELIGHMASLRAEERHDRELERTLWSQVQ
ncbi:hypothetical protein N7471_008672 [Penicillium samsonianum]|uniref:uncharacterized protein n=1 Tax=Penicillium samsonianum TaxID=1882272 RepID=UPI0025467EE8|nr:uncharacterized protein N7471_008672 [Penicillium samsonianum]KAJ6133457.1 hypothetical protein N7471_008672 [Penicillium samsonianum]